MSKTKTEHKDEKWAKGFNETLINPSKKRYSKANKYKKGCSTSLVNREMQINTKQECKVIQPSILGNFSVVSNKSKHLPYGLKIHSSIYIPKTDGCIHTHTHTHTHS